MSTDPALSPTSFNIDASLNRRHYILSTLLVLLVTFVFFRSILPRLPRLLFRGRLRVQRLGLRGARGIEWRSKGFIRTKVASHQHPSSQKDDELNREDIEGLSVGIRRIWLQFHASKRDTEDKLDGLAEARQRKDGSKGESESEEEDDYETKASVRPSKAWVTLRIEGVGITLPAIEAESDDEQEKVQKRKDQFDRDRKEEEKAKRAEEDRLDFLMQSRPSSPALGITSSARQSRSVSPMPAFTTAMDQLASSNPNEEVFVKSSTPNDSPINPIALMSRYTKDTILPFLWVSLMSIFRALLYLLTSALPFLSSTIDIEITKVEIYHKQSEAVVRLESIGLDLHMSLIPSPKNVNNSDNSPSASSRPCKSVSQRISEVIASMPDRAKGAASFVTDGLPAGRISLHLTTTGLQVFEATLARREQNVKSKKRESTSQDESPSTPEMPTHTFDSQPLHFSPNPNKSNKGHNEWNSFSAAFPSANESLKRSRSFVNLTNFGYNSDGGFRGWTDWALEAQPNSGFTPQTGWRRESDKGKGRIINASARVLSMPESSRFKLSLVLTGTSSISSKESIHIGIDLSEATVGTEALIKVAKALEKHKAIRSGPAPSEEGDQGTRSTMSKHFKQQRPAAQAIFLEQLGSASFHWPCLTIITSVKSTPPHLSNEAEWNHKEDMHLPSSVQVFAEIRNVHFSIKTSDPTDELHQRWLGTCGIKGYRPPKEVGRFSNRFRWNPHHQKVRYVEHRRAFQIEAGIGLIHTRIGIDGESVDLQSELLRLEQLSIKIRSTWTPVGLLVSAKENTLATARRFFQSDPNEQCAVVDVSLTKVVGDLKIKHATALLASLQTKISERKREEELGLSKEKPSRPNGFLESIPKTAIGISLSDLSYRLDATELLPLTHLEQVLNKPELGLIFAVPRISFAFHASYVDEYVRRGDLERKAAWKSLSNDELEWSLRDDTLGKIRRQQREQEMNISPRLPQGEYASWQENPEEEDESEEDRHEQERFKKERYTQSEVMTIKEAILKMKEIQRVEALQNQPERRRAIDVKNRWKRFAEKKERLHHVCPYNTRLNFESQCTIESIELFWAMTGDGVSSRRRTEDDTFTETTAAIRSSSSDLVKHHIICLERFELGPCGSLPGFQDVTSSAVRLDKSKASVDVRISLEEVDVDMWHPAALDATKRVLSHFMHNQRSSNKDEEVDGINGAPQEETPFDETKAEGVDESEKPVLIEAIKAGVSVYTSIGSIICHIASIDQNCDRKMSRGIGFESKRVVLEAACFEKEHKRAIDRLKLALGARSTLQLPEDMRSSCNALATRYGKGGMLKLSLYEIGLFPLLDAEQASAQHLHQSNENQTASDEDKWTNLASPSIIAPEVWEFQKTRPSISSTKRIRPKYRQQDRNHFIFWMPFSSTSISLIPKVLLHEKIGSQDEQLTITVDNTRLISLKIELLHTYCLLMAFTTIKGLFPEKPKGLKSKADADAKPKKVVKPSKYQPITHHTIIKVDELYVFFSLPTDVNLFVYIRRLDCNDSTTRPMSVGFETLMGAVESAKKPSKGMWDEMLRMRDCRISSEASTEDQPAKIHVNADGARVRVPFGYTVHPIIDSTVVSVKATKQLLHQFIKGTKHSVIHPVAEGPKHLPIIKLKMRILSMEAEDDPFETSLNIIWRAGGDEHQARAERDAAFREKVAQLEKRTPLSRMQSTASTIESYTETISSSSSDEDDTSNAKASLNVVATETISVDQAKQSLDAFNASSWIRRYRNAKEEQERREENNRRKIYGRLKTVLKEQVLPIKLSEPSMTTPLFRSTMTKLEIQIGPTSFPESQLRDFLYDQGQGIPRDTEYSIFIPMHLCLTMAEWKLTLRDYPLPLLHLPPTNATSQPEHLPAWEMNTDMCIAEQLGTQAAIRHITAIVVPAATGRPDAIEYGISVPRMSVPTKFFGSPIIKINSCYPTRLVWGQSIQPAIHDFTRVLEGITSPPHDPSSRIGFWDKLSLIFHGKVHFQFAQEGELHLYLKGSRDPYHILEHGAGWVKCWRGNVEMKLGFENDEKEIFQILSDEYLLAIPDLRDYIDRAATGTESSQNKRSNSQSSDDYSSNKLPSLSSNRKRYMKKPEYKKICMKLTDGVRWGSGLHLERTCTDQSCCQEVKCKGEPFHRECRFWNRIPHWQVYTRSHDYAATIPKEEFGDSYDGWRSHHLHFSISLYSRKTDLRQSVEGHTKKEKKKVDAVNNLYFTPLSWEHFFAWTRLFNSALSLPIRQGPLFPGSMAQSPKFGRHLATIKYRFDISPLFITHVYPQHEKADWARGVTTLLGIKSRLSTFHFDLHQRQQEMLKDRPALGETRKVFHKPFYEAEVDLAEIDLRTLAGQFIEPEKQLYTPDDYDDDTHQAQHDVIFGNDSESTRVPERDKEWYDVGDFVELDWMPPFDGIPPKIRLMQAMTCPRFNYYRHIESQRERRARTGEEAKDLYPDHDNKDARRGSKGSDADSDGLERLEKSKFGKEDTHACLVGKAPSTVEVQIVLAEDRIRFLTEELHKLGEDDDDGSVIVHSVEDEMSNEDRANEVAKAAEINLDKSCGDKTQAISKDLQKKIHLIEQYVEMLRNIIKSSTFGQGEEVEQDEAGKAAHDFFAMPFRGGMSNTLDVKALHHEWEAFDNRYFAHNPTIFVSNATRDVLLKYYLSSRRRRGLVHSLSARAVRYIRDLTKPKDLEEKHSHHHHHYRPDHHARDSQRRESRREHHDDQEELLEEGRGEDINGSAEEGKANTASRRSSEVEEEEGNANGPELLRGLLRDTMQYMMVDDGEGTSISDAGKQLTTFDQEEGDPTFGISDEYEVRKSNISVLLKPQIVLRSLVDEKSTMILTAIRSRMHNYSVRDPTVEEDSVNERALYRNYVAIDGLQSFHPSEHCSFRQRAKERYGFLHVPLETLIDLKYETKDFDRIAPRTDASMHYDKFNKLRMHDTSRPIAANSDSEDPAIDHLRHYMDLIRLRCPKFAVLANSEHFGAIYNIVTDLLLYRDPTYREYAKRLEMMMLSYDLSDFDTLASVVQALQIRIRHAKELHVQYHLHFQHLNEQGRYDFLSLKAELKDSIDELGLLMEAIKAKDDQSSTDKDKKSAIRVEAQANDIAWNMMGQEEGELLAKLTIKGASFTWLNKADNSAANTLSITDLNAVNVHPDAFFTEIITKYNNVENHPMKQRGVLLNAIWSVLAPVGGISIVDHMEIGLHPLSIQLEKRIGRRLEDYIFGSKREREKKNLEQKRAEEEMIKESKSKPSRLKRIAHAIKGRDSQDSSLHHELQEERGGNAKMRKSLPARNASISKRDTPPIDKRRSGLIKVSNRSVSTRSSMSDLKSSRMNSPPLNHNGHYGNDDGQSGDSDSDETGQRAIAAKNAIEMRSRASRNTSFVYAKVFETIFCLSYKGEKQKSITDLYDLVFRAPRLEYRNRTWTHADLLNHLKKDILKAAWRQKSTLLKGVINHRRPRHQAVADNIRALRDAQLTRRMISSGTASFSALQSSSTITSSDSNFNSNNNINKIQERFKSDAGGDDDEEEEEEEKSTMNKARNEVLRSVDGDGGDEDGAGSGLRRFKGGLRNRKDSNSNSNHEKDSNTLPPPPPPFKFSIDPPDDNPANGVSRRNEDLLGLTAQHQQMQKGKEKERERERSSDEYSGSKEQEKEHNEVNSRDDVEQQQSSSTNRGGTRKLGKYLAKRLTGKRSNSLANSQGRQLPYSGEKEEDDDAKARAKRGEREGTVDSDSEDDIGHDDTPDHSSDDEDNNDDEEEETPAEESIEHFENSRDADDEKSTDRRIDQRDKSPSSAIHSPQSGRSLLSFKSSRISSPSSSRSTLSEVTVHHDRKRTNNNSQGGILGSGIKVSTSSLPKITSPWQMKKESGNGAINESAHSSQQS